jgi:cytochrome b561
MITITLHWTVWALIGMVIAFYFIEAFEKRGKRSDSQESRAK